MENNVRITALYQDYNTVIKPLIAEVEARTEQFPLPMLIALVAQYSRRWRSSNCWMYVKSVSEKASARIFVFIITAWKSVVKIQIF